MARVGRPRMTFDWKAFRNAALQHYAEYDGTLDDLALELGLAQSTVSRIIGGRNKGIPAETFARFIIWMNVSADDFMIRRDDHGRRIDILGKQIDPRQNKEEKIEWQPHSWIARARKTSAGAASASTRGGRTSGESPTV